MQAAPYQHQKTYHQRRLGELMTLRTPYEDQWADQADFVEPSRFRRELDQGLGRKNRTKIVDSTGTDGFRTLASGFHSGASSPARPWYRMATFDTALKDHPTTNTRRSHRCSAPSRCG